MIIVLLLIFIVAIHNLECSWAILSKSDETMGKQASIQYEFNYKNNSFCINLNHTYHWALKKQTKKLSKEYLRIVKVIFHRIEIKRENPLRQIAIASAL